MIKQVELNLENYGISQFLFYKTTSLEEVERGELEVLKKGQIPGLLPCAVLKQEEDVIIRYDLISDSTLEMLLTKPVSKEMLSESLSNIAQTLMAAHECGLNIDHFVFNPKHIFIDNFSRRLVFIYLPVKNNIFEKVSLKDFLKEILYLAPFDENDDPHFFIKLHNYLLKQTEIKAEDLSERLQAWSEADKQSREAEEACTKNTVYSKMEQPTVVNPNFYSPGNPVNLENQINTASPVNLENQINPQSPVSQINKVKTTVDGGVITSEYSSKKKEKKKSRQLEIEEEVNYKRITRTELGDHFPLLKGGAAMGGTSIKIQPNLGSAFTNNDEPEGTTVLGASHNDEEEGTTMLGVGMRETSKPYLLAPTQNEKITITKNVFKIGRDPGQADYTSKNKVVGRVHALIITVNGEYFFEDNHSRNGSFVNGIKVGPNDRIKIKHDDRIKLANEEYIFRLF